MSTEIETLQAEVDEVDNRRALYVARLTLALSEVKHTKELLDEVNQRKQDLTLAIFKLRVVE